MENQLRISGCVADSIVDGPGMRFVVFVQGCPHHCPGCQNPQTHDFSAGHITDHTAIINEVLKNPLARGITFSGGEPFCQTKALLNIAREIVAGGKDVVIYTGYTLETLLDMGKDNPTILELLSLAELLIDGLYIEAYRDLTLQFRGSSNQRLLDKNILREALDKIQKTTCVS